MSRTRKGRDHAESQDERDVPTESVAMSDHEESDSNQIKNTKRKRIRKLESPLEEAKQTTETKKSKKQKTHSDSSSSTKPVDTDDEPLAKRVKPTMATEVTPPVMATLANTDNVEMKIEQPVNMASLYPRTQRDFSAADFDTLSINEHFRFIDNAKKVGHAVITKNANGEEVAYQFDIPQGLAEETPRIRPLENIEAITRFTMRRFRATTPESKTPMYAKRFIHAKLGNKADPNSVQDVTIACFSPTNNKNPNEEPFWGSAKTVPVFRGNLKGNAKKEQEETKGHTKGGRELKVDPESVQRRDGMTRNPDQNTVMMGSAVEAFRDFVDSMKDVLTPEIIEIMETSIKAPLHNQIKSNNRPEWLHAEGFGLTPHWMDPQRKDNLAAAPKWANTEMMILERVAKWVALNRPDAFVKIKPVFEMLMDSDLAKRIKFEVTIEEKQRFIKFMQDIDPFQKYPAFRKATDIAQTTVLTQRLLEGAAPARMQKVIAGDHNTSSSSTRTALIPSANSAFSSTSLSAFANASSSAKTNLLLNDNAIIPAINKNAATRSKYAKSVVELIVDSQLGDYDEPWRGPTNESCTGSGVVISHQGKPYILTNAHVVADAALIRVRVANSKKKKYVATPIKVGYMCDLALIEVTDPEFLAQVEPAELGDMVSLQQPVTTVGFPIGGTELSISDGVVSRIQTDEYAESGEDLVQVQVDAAINSGNSGGGTFSGDKLVGISFQAVRGRAGLGYFIPMEIVNRFLIEAMKPGPFRGFPILPASLQTLENDALKKYYGMTEGQSGVRVIGVDEVCDAGTKLKTGDILLTIDGLTISDEGTVDLPIGDVIDMSHVMHKKNFGDTTRFELLRKNETTKQVERLTVDVLMDVGPHEAEKVPTEEHDKMPTYYFGSGILFQPLTRNYLASKGSDIDTFYFVEAGSTIANISKKAPSDEIVIVNQILSTDKTGGYDEFVNSIVKEINDKKVNNMREVVAAIESNTESTLRVMTAGKTHIVVPRMSKEEQAQLLRKRHIHSDRSDDIDDMLRAQAQIDQSAAMTASTAVMPATTSSTTAAMIAPVQPVPSAQPAVTVQSAAPKLKDALKVRRRKPRIEDSDSEHEEKKELTALDMPGYKRYRAHLDTMETFFEENQRGFKHDKDADLDNLPDMSDSEADEDYTPGGEESESLGSESSAHSDSESSNSSGSRSDSPSSSSASESSSESEEERHSKSKGKHKHAASRHGMFSKSHKNDRDNADVEMEHSASSKHKHR
jgi:large subunit ribosomal protein L28